MFVVRTDQDAMPFPAAGFRWLNEQEHLTLEEVRGEPAKHSLGEEGRVLNKRLENPLVFERLHGFELLGAIANSLKPEATFIQAELSTEKKITRSEAHG